MRNLKYYVFTIICIIMFPIIGHAECSYERQAELSRIASNVQLSYTYDETNGFIIYMTNLTSDLYAEDSHGKKINGGQEYSESAASSSYSYVIYSNDSNCYGDKLVTKSITIPTLNAFSFSDECKAYPNFKYCQKWGSFDLTSDQFEQALNKYKGEVEKKRKTTVESENVWKIILNVLSENVFVICFLCISAIIAIVIKLIYSRK